MTKQETSVRCARALYKLIKNISPYLRPIDSPGESLQKARRMVMRGKGFCEKDRDKYLSYIEKMNVKLNSRRGDANYLFCRIQNSLTDDLYPKTNPEWTISFSRRKEATLSDLISP